LSLAEGRKRTSGRRGRKGYAKDAKEEKKDKKDKKDKKAEFKNICREVQKR
jgi:hypothetical protein